MHRMCSARPINPPHECVCAVPQPSCQLTLTHTVVVSEAQLHCALTAQVIRAHITRHRRAEVERRVPAVVVDGQLDGLPLLRQEDVAERVPLHAKSSRAAA
eukprot:939355-Prymnesium_polylepis.1